MDQSENKYSFRQFLIPIDNSQPTHSSSSSKRISPNILQAIADSSQSPPTFSLSLKIIQFYKSLAFIIRPGNPYLLAWQVLLVFIIILYLLELGLLVAFGEQFWIDQLDNLLSTHIIFIFVLTSDILISPIKAYYDEGLLITDVATIFRKYISFQLWIDVIGLVVIIIPIASGWLASNWIKILWILKIYTGSKINVEFQRVTQLYITLNTGYLVLKLIAAGYVYGHYMGIFFYMVSKWVYVNNFYGPNTPNLCWIYNAWALYQMELYLTWQQMYIYIMYYSIAVVTTIAYGDITPKNPVQCIYTIFALIIVTLIFGYIMTQILRVLITVFSYNYDRRFVHFELVSRLKNENVQQNIQIQVRAHSSEIDREEQYRNRNIQEQIMNFLPSQPLYGLMTVIYSSFLNEIGFSFLKQSSVKMQPTHHRSFFLQNFMKDIKEERHYTGDLLYCQKQNHDTRPGGHCTYFFTKQQYSSSVMLGVGAIPLLKIGKLDSSDNQNKNHFQICRAKNLFGQVQFLNGQERSHWAFCLSNCVLFVASRQSLLNNYSLLTQQEKEMVFARMQTAESVCLICGEDHALLNCHYAFLNTNDTLQQDRRVFRKNKILKQSRTRLKSESSWTVYQRVREMKVKVTKQYKDKLLLNKANHSLFIQYQLEQDNCDHEEEDFETKLHETQIMVDKLYEQLLDQMGKTSEAIQYDHVYNYRTYKPHNNITNITANWNKHERRQAILNSIARFIR